MVFRAFMIVVVCVFSIHGVFASHNEYVFSMGGQHVYAKSGARLRIDAEVGGGNHLVISLRERACSVGCMQDQQDDLMIKQCAHYTFTSQKTTQEGEYAMDDSALLVSHWNVKETEKDLDLHSHKPLILLSNVLNAHNDVLIVAPYIAMEALYCTSVSERVILRAPDACKGWLRSVTFERAPGERPFDMMFQGTVSFDPPSIESLLVVGASKVSFEVRAPGYVRPKVAATRCLFDKGM